MNKRTIAVYGSLLGFLLIGSAVVFFGIDVERSHGAFPSVFIKIIEGSGLEANDCTIKVLDSEAGNELVGFTVPGKTASDGNGWVHLAKYGERNTFALYLFRSARLYGKIVPSPLIQIHRGGKVIYEVRLDGLIGEVKKRENLRTVEILEGESGAFVHVPGQGNIKAIFLKIKL